MAYLIEMFHGSILNYSRYDKELCTLHQAMKRWRVYLHGKGVVVHSKQKPLQFLTLQSKLHQARYMKWISYLQPFNVVTKYKKRVTNKLVDMLSMLPTMATSSLWVAMQILSVTPSNFVKGYVTDPQLRNIYKKLLQQK